MGTGSAIYRIILLGHIAAAIVGFGGLIAHGFYHAKAVGAQAVETRALLRTTSDVARWAEYGVYAVLAFGIVLVSLSDDVFGFDEPWISASFVVWFLMVGLNHGLVRPARSKLIDAADSMDESNSVTLADDSSTKALLGRLAIGEGATQILLIVALVLMIWKPGH
jgi:uncharacterized membrane protein